ncbi:hypothetical protein BU17DRAFT_61528 [Hysterangium stoloniferum]|nr:hypothetical protein BU17DRAFT_61526 [Hysterangium stoloniferum]KAF8527368.1 hypothetical protein BU17DRAFT_61528 [Hysterangium stoloniferum]
MHVRRTVCGYVALMEHSKDSRLLFTFNANFTAGGEPNQDKTIKYINDSNTHKFLSHRSEAESTVAADLGAYDVVSTLKQPMHQEKRGTPKTNDHERNVRINQEWGATAKWHMSSNLVWRYADRPLRSWVKVPQSHQGVLGDITLVVVPHNTTLNLRQCVNAFLPGRIVYGINATRYQGKRGTQPGQNNEAESTVADLGAYDVVSTLKQPMHQEKRGTPKTNDHERNVRINQEWGATAKWHMSSNLVWRYADRPLRSWVKVPQSHQGVLVGSALVAEPHSTHIGSASMHFFLGGLCTASVRRVAGLGPAGDNADHGDIHTKAERVLRLEARVAHQIEIDTVQAIINAPASPTQSIAAILIFLIQANGHFSVQSSPFNIFQTYTAKKFPMSFTQRILFYRVAVRKEFGSHDESGALFNPFNNNRPSPSPQRILLYRGSPSDTGLGYTCMLLYRVAVGDWFGL